MSEKPTGTVSYKLDPRNPPRMSNEQMAYLRELKDEDIDYSDIPPLAEKLGRRVGGARFGLEAVLLDEDVQEFFRRDGVISSERVNAVLREYVDAHRKTA